ncbi:MAG: putative quinol monooxygenase [Cyclobacteriaceae bacterium]
MIIRIVRMHFTEVSSIAFLEIFYQHKEAIRHFAGCSHLQLLKDAKDPLCYTTLSHWDKPESLENYRNSELFEGVWSRVKPLFSKRTEAFSLEKFIEL